MATGGSYRTEAEFPLEVTWEDARDGVCRDPLDCTITRTGRRGGLEEFETFFDVNNAMVRVLWNEGDRRHDGVLAPPGEAIRVLALTDANKAALVRQLRRNGPVILTVTQHRSRLRQASPRTPEQRQAELDRKAELAERRALPEADPRWLPPAVPRRSSPRLGSRRDRISLA